MLNGTTIYCDCCGSEKLAEIIGENLVIKDRRHGQKHIAVVPIRQLIDKLDGTKYRIVKEAATVGRQA